jgi:hypothetical protein
MGRFLLEEHTCQLMTDHNIEQGNEALKAISED